MLASLRSCSIRFSIVHMFSGSGGKVKVWSLWDMIGLVYRPRLGQYAKKVVI
jgi:hypothetical protein